MSAELNLKDLDGMWQIAGVRAPRPCQVEVAVETVADRDILAARCLGHGWATLTDKVVLVDGAFPAGRNVLAAELATGAASGCSVQWNGEVWRVTDVTEGRGEDAVAFEAEHVTDRGPAGADRIRYVVYWVKRKDRGCAVWQPGASRWVGFRNGEEAAQ